MKKSKVLFICVHNSSRSQMAEALFKLHCGHRFDVQSAGLTPGQLNPLAVEAMQEIGLDISHHKTQSAFDVYKTGQIFKYVIIVCTEAEGDGCPIFPVITTRLFWPFPDPSSFQGTHAEKLERTRQVRDMIAQKIEEWCKENCPPTECVAEDSTPSD